MISYVFFIVAAFTSASLFFSIKKNIELLEKIEEITTQVEESLDILDECHQKIDAKSKINVLFDDPVVKEFLQDVQDCKQAVLLVANKLYDPLSEEKENME